VKVFVDTSALLALFDRGEDRHSLAKECLAELASARLIISDYVLDESLTRWLTSGRAVPGLAFVDALLRSPRHELVFVGEDSFRESLVRAEKLAEQGLSFTDCTNVVLVEALGLDAIFAFDEGFAHVGLQVVPPPGRWPGAGPRRKATRRKRPRRGV